MSSAAYSLPIRPGSVVWLQGEFPLDEEGWDRLMQILEAMKPGLVESKQPVGADGDKSELAEAL